MRLACPAPVFQALALSALCAGLSCAQAQGSDLFTRTGHSLGLSLSQHRYEEPGYMSLKSRKTGVEYAYTQALGSSWPRADENWFVRGELGYANGRADYSSPLSGRMDGKPDRYLQARALVGKDLDLGGYVLAPYAGLGLRLHHNDLRGVSSLGIPGYRRDNQLRYALLGATHKMALADQAQLHTTVEYMHLLRGTQSAHRSDASALLTDLSLRQNQGRGLRLQLMHHTQRWSIGPSLSYWQIEASETAGNPPAFEPKNKSYELGFKAAYQF